MEPLHFTRIIPIAEEFLPATPMQVPETVIGFNHEFDPNQLAHVLNQRNDLNRCVLLGCQEGQLLMQDLNNNNAYAQGVGTHKSPITCICPLPDKRFAVGSADGIVRIWNLKAQTSTLLHQGTQAIVCLSLVPNEGIAIASKNGKVKILSLDGDKMMTQFEPQPSAPTTTASPQPQPILSAVPTTTASPQTVQPAFSMNRSNRCLLITACALVVLARLIYFLFETKKG